MSSTVIQLGFPASVSIDRARTVTMKPASLSAQNPKKQRKIGRTSRPVIRAGSIKYRVRNEDHGCQQAAKHLRSTWKSALEDLNDLR